MNHDLDMEKFQLSFSIINYICKITDDTLKLYFLSMQYDKYFIEANSWNKKDLKNQLILTESLKIYFSTLSLCDQQIVQHPLQLERKILSKIEVR